MLGRMQLSPACARVLGALMEKGLATRQQYPLTVNALQSACNQTSNREPVVSYDETTVLAALDELKDQKRVRSVLPTHGRSSATARFSTRPWPSVRANAQSCPSSCSAGTSPSASCASRPSA